jgi:sugar (pentulose or hexulose) kinase
MSVVGIDLGAQSTKIGVARNKGIDIVSSSSVDGFKLAMMLTVPTDNK